VTKTKTKTKSLTKTNASFPAGGWQYDMEYAVDLPIFFENPAWRQVRIDPPPGPDETVEELARLMEMQNDVEGRKRRKTEIEQEADAFGNLPFERALMLGPSGAYPATYALMHAMIVVGKYVVAHYKNRFMRARPSQLEPRLRPLLDVPGHPAYPSGHATQMFLAAKALATVVRSHEIGEQLFEIAKQVAENREWAGLHYRSDTDAGRRLAVAIFPQVEDAFSESFQAENQRLARLDISEARRRLQEMHEKSPANIPAKTDTTTESIEKFTSAELAKIPAAQTWNVDRLEVLSIATTDNLGPFGYNVEPPGEYCKATGDFGFGGTSAAAAQVAGVVALMLAANGNLKGQADDIRRLLHASASHEYLIEEIANELPKGRDGNYRSLEFGYGLLDADTAVKHAIEWPNVKFG
jgi:hypothetical protein